MKASDWLRQTFGCKSAKCGRIFKIPSLDGPSHHWLQFCFWVTWPKWRLLIGWEQKWRISAKWGPICKIPTLEGPWCHWPSFEHAGHMTEIEASDWSRAKMAHFSQMGSDLQNSNLRWSLKPLAIFWAWWSHDQNWGLWLAESKNGHNSAKWGPICKILTLDGPWCHWPSFEHAGHMTEIKASDWSRAKMAYLSQMGSDLQNSNFRWSLKPLAIFWACWSHDQNQGLWLVESKNGHNSAKCVLICKILTSGAPLTTICGTGWNRGFWLVESKNGHKSAKAHICKIPILGNPLTSLRGSCHMTEIEASLLLVCSRGFAGDIQGLSHSQGPRLKPWTSNFIYLNTSTSWLL